MISDSILFASVPHTRLPPPHTRCVLHRVEQRIQHITGTKTLNSTTENRTENKALRRFHNLFFLDDMFFDPTHVMRLLGANGDVYYVACAIRCVCFSLSVHLPRSFVLHTFSLDPFFHFQILLFFVSLCLPHPRVHSFNTLFLPSQIPFRPRFFRSFIPSQIPVLRSKIFLPSRSLVGFSLFHSPFFVVCNSSHLLPAMFPIRSVPPFPCQLIAVLLPYIKPLPSDSPPPLNTCYTSCPSASRAKPPTVVLSIRIFDRAWTPSSMSGGRPQFLHQPRHPDTLHVHSFCFLQRGVILTNNLVVIKHLL